MTANTFDAWWTEVQQIARNTETEWLLGQPNDHRPAFDDGMSPLECLQAEMDAAHDDSPTITH